MAGFTKIFSSILDSTIWCEPWPIKGVWLTMLTMADQYGNVHASVPGLAKRATVSIEECEEALRKFMAPDPYSRTPDFEGRRIEVMDGGWHLLNYLRYREMRDEDARREQNRIAQQKHRMSAKNADGQQNDLTNPPMSATVSQGQPQSAQAEAEAEAEKNNETANAVSTVVAAPRKKRRTQDEILQPYPQEVRDVANHCIRSWRKEDPDGRPIVADKDLLCANIAAVLRDHKTLTSAELIQGVDDYLAKEKQRYCAPQFYFGPGKPGETPKWAVQTRMIRHQESRRTALPLEPAS